VDGLSGPVDGLGGLVYGFLFFVFYLIYRGRHLNRLGKDGFTGAFVRAVVMLASVNPFCPPPKKHFVVVDMIA
jgi:hypothetical protein